MRAAAATARHRACPGCASRHTGAIPAGTVPGAAGEAGIAIPFGALTSAAWLTVSSSVLPPASAACNRTARYPGFRLAGTVNVPCTWWVPVRVAVIGAQVLPSS